MYELPKGAHMLLLRYIYIVHSEILTSEFRMSLEFHLPTHLMKFVLARAVHVVLFPVCAQSGPVNEANSW